MVPKDKHRIATVSSIELSPCRLTRTQLDSRLTQYNVFLITPSITSINNSPIFADFSQTLSGTSSIRAYGASERFASNCESSFDKMDASYVLVQVVNQWLALRLDVLGGLVGKRDVLVFSCSHTLFRLVLTYVYGS
jgi:hypothetical protein